MKHKNRKAALWSLSANGSCSTQRGQLMAAPLKWHSCEELCYTANSLLAHTKISKCTFELLLGKKPFNIFSHDQLSNTAICPKRESAVKTNFENKVRCQH